MLGRLVIACLLALSLCLGSSAGVIGAEPLPVPEAMEPLVPLNDFASESGWLARWRADHQRRAATDGMIQTDRPSFTLSDSVVPKGWVQLESGYLYTNSHAQNSIYELTRDVHTLPQLNLRWGVTNWAELRVLWGGVGLIREEFSAPIYGIHGTFTATRTANLEVGAKFQTTQQNDWLPKSALVTTLFLPTSNDYAYAGPQSIINNGVQPAIDYIYTWSLTDRVSVGGSSGAVLSNLVTDPTFMQFFQSAILRFHWSPQVSLFYEWYTSAQKSFGETEWFPIVDAGIQWRPRANLQFDWRVGLPIGSRYQMDGAFTGVGASLRY